MDLNKVFGELKGPLTKMLEIDADTLLSANLSNQGKIVKVSLRAPSAAEDLDSLKKRFPLILVLESGEKLTVNLWESDPKKRAPIKFKIIVRIPWTTKVEKEKQEELGKELFQFFAPVHSVFVDAITGLMTVIFDQAHIPALLLGRLKLSFQAVDVDANDDAAIEILWPYEQYCLTLLTR